MISNKGVIPSRQDTGQSLCRDSNKFGIIGARRRKAIRSAEVASKCCESGEVLTGHELRLDQLWLGLPGWGLSDFERPETLNEPRKYSQMICPGASQDDVQENDPQFGTKYTFKNKKLDEYPRASQKQNEENVYFSTLQN